jgi:hypothetical protein
MRLLSSYRATKSSKSLSTRRGFLAIGGAVTDLHVIYHGAIAMVECNAAKYACSGHYYSGVWSNFSSVGVNTYHRARTQDFHHYCMVTIHHSRAVISTAHVAQDQHSSGVLAQWQIMWAGKSLHRPRAGAEGRVYRLGPMHGKLARQGMGPH